MRTLYRTTCLLLVAGVVVLYGVADAGTFSVSNVNASQRFGTTGAGTIVDIMYDLLPSGALEAAQGDSAYVTIEVSNDGGATFDVPASTITGHVGKVAIGFGKPAEWHAGVDVPGVLWEECQVKVTAGDLPASEIVVDLPGGATMTMLWIEPGTFMMGSPPEEPGRSEHEGPQHEVTITRGFYLGKYELTQGQWQSVMGTTPWAGQAMVQENPNNPAVWISWDQVQTLIDSLNAAEGPAMYRLPTEAEWEYACRAGTATRWSFGDDVGQVGQYAWYFDNAWDVGEQYAHTVGTKLANPWGLHDMHGNAYEWCLDWYGAYNGDAQTNPTGPAAGSFRVLRGGAVPYYSFNVRSASRDSDSPGSRNGTIGVRLLRQGP